MGYPWRNEPPEPNPDWVPPRSDDTLIEPRMITGLGPQGSDLGMGRGEVGLRGRRRLIFYCLIVRDGVS